MKKKSKLFSDFSLNGNDVHVGLAEAFLLELDDAVAFSVQRVVFAHTDVLAGIVPRAALADDDVASDGGLTTEKFHSESFTGGLATVFGTTYTFFVCHNLFCFLRFLTQ